MRALSFVSALFVLAGCQSATCERVLCGPCPSSFVVEVSGSSAGTVATLSDGGTCDASSGTARCTASLAPGDHRVTLTIDGVARTLDVTIAPAPAGCCACPPTVMQTVSVTSGDGGVTDAGP